MGAWRGNGSVRGGRLSAGVMNAGVGRLRFSRHKGKVAVAKIMIGPAG